MTNLILPNALVVDISHWDPMTETQFATARDHGNLVGVIVKLLQDGNPDDQALNNIKAAQAAGGIELGVYDMVGSPARLLVGAFFALAWTKLQTSSHCMRLAVTPCTFLS